MSRIIRLESNLINKIAAGEVVERPASVVKELVENSIDAGAKRITVEIENGGTTLIRVADDGSGIERAYVREAFLRHATSKITSLEDLEGVMTLGFRGEALSSIASVSRVEIVTKTEVDDTGIRLELEGGAVISEEETAASVGTGFTVRNLFFNTPARLKFMKKPSVESGYVSDIISKLILAHPEISFEYLSNGSVMLRSGGTGDVKAAALAVYGRDAVSKTIEISSEKNGFELCGLIGRPELYRSNRGYGQFFINGRYIKSELVGRAMEEAYKTRLLSGKFPVFILYLKTPPQNVDVNVHPTKLEVRFTDEEFIFEFVKAAAEKALSKETLIPSASLDDRRPTFGELTETVPYEAEADDFDALLEYAAVAVNEEAVVYDSKISQSANSSDYPPEDESGEKCEKESGKEPEKEREKETATVPLAYESNLEKSEGAAARKSFFHNYKICGQVFRTYWIVEQGDCLYLIDQHAAHEKVLYEEFTHKYRTENVVSQKLISPVAVNLNDRELRVVKENRELFEKLGFELEDFGGASFAVRSAPYVMGDVSGAGFFIEIVDSLMNIDTSVNNSYDLKIDAIASQACKAAVKASDKLSYIEAKELIDRLLELKNPFSCPHGRPTIIELTKYEIEKKFKRVQQ